MGYAFLFQRHREIPSVASHLEDIGESAPLLLGKDPNQRRVEAGSRLPLSRSYVVGYFGGEGIEIDRHIEFLPPVGGELFFYEPLKELFNLLIKVVESGKVEFPL